MKCPCGNDLPETSGRRRRPTFKGPKKQALCAPCYNEYRLRLSKTMTWQYPCREYVAWITRPIGAVNESP